MALTRSYLKGMGLTEEQVSAIVDAHMETVNGLKEQVKQFQTDAEKLPAVQKELDKLKSTGSDWESKYNSEHKAFEEYKTAQTAKETKAHKMDAFKAALRASGIAEKYFDTVIRASQTDIDAIEIDDKGAAKDAAKLADTLKTAWSDFVQVTKNTGAAVTTPPANTGTSVTKEQFAKMGYQSKVKLKNENPELYEALRNQE